MSDFLKLRGGYRRLQTPARVATFARSSVNLVALDVSCCRNGCMAFTTDDDAVTCVHCNARRFKNGSVPSMVVPYWPITPWLRMMLLDPELSVAMRDYMVIARQRAAEEDVASYSDWYDGASFRKLVKDGLIVSNADIVLGVALDGFDSWRQTGCKGWPVVVTVLSLPPEMRTKTVCMLPVMITPGPGEPIDLDSFLRPLLVELHSLAAGVAGVSIYEGEEHGHTLRAFCVQVTTDMPAGQKVTHMTGHAGYTPNRFRTFHGTLWGTTYYFPPVDPHTAKQLFSVASPSTDLRGRASGTTAASPGSDNEQAADRGIQGDADEVEAMRAAGRPAAHVKALSRQTGVNGWSSMLTPRPVTRAELPSLAYLWGLGPVGVAPYDPMHLFFCNVVPKLWSLATGTFEVEKDVSDAFVLGRTVRTAMGKEYKAAAATVPARQARTLRNIDTRCGSSKAADWLFFLLCGGDVLLYGRAPDNFYEMFMCLCRAGRVLFRPSAVSPSELSAAEAEIKAFLVAFYDIVYGGRKERLKVCLFVFAALLDVVPNVKQCGPAWVFWQFPLERYIGTLPGMIGSRSKPHQSLVNALAKRQRAELLEAFASRMCPDHWRAATGQYGRDAIADPVGGVEADDGAGGRWRFPVLDGDVVALTLLHPVEPCMDLVGAQFAALQRHDAELVADGTTTRKCYRMEMRDGTVVRAGDTDMGEDCDRRRTSLVRVQSSDRRQSHGRAVETVSLSTYGVVEHFLLCEGPARLTAVAYIRLVRSRRDPRGRYGIADKVRGMDVFKAYDGTRRYIDAMSISASVGCFTRDNRHHVLFTRETFSHSIDAE